MRIVYFLVESILLFVLWLIFVSTSQPHELVVGAGASALAAAATEAVRGSEHPRFLPHLEWILRSRRLPFEILRDCGLLIRNLLRGGRGRFELQPFPAGGDDAHSVARRALAIFYTTLPPNTLVIGIDRRRDTMLLHRLERTS